MQRACQLILVGVLTGSASGQVVVQELPLLPENVSANGKIVVGATGGEPALWGEGGLVVVLNAQGALVDVTGESVGASIALGHAAATDLPAGLCPSQGNSAPFVSINGGPASTEPSGFAMGQPIEFPFAIGTVRAVGGTQVDALCNPEPVGWVTPLLGGCHDALTPQDLVVFDAAYLVDIEETDSIAVGNLGCVGTCLDPSTGRIIIPPLPDSGSTGRGVPAPCQVPLGVYGFVYTPDAPTQPDSWILEGPTPGAPSMTTAIASGAFGVAPTVVGAAFDGHWRAARWSSANFDPAPNLATIIGPPNLHSSALDISADGSIICGFESNNAEVDGDDLAFLIDADGTYQVLQDLVLAQGGDLTGWNRLLRAVAISDDGRIVVGVGERADGTEAGFRIGPDCNGNQIFDVQDICDGTSEDCNENGVPDECDIANMTSEDCNNNGTPDECEFADGDADCNVDGILDECQTELDCNQNGIIDPCECITDIVFIVDTSGSMVQERDALCGSVLCDVVTAIAGGTEIDLRITVHEIGADVMVCGGADVPPFDCPGVATSFSSYMQDPDADVYFLAQPTAEQLAPPFELSCDDEQPRMDGRAGLEVEDWGRAAAAVARDNEWRFTDGLRHARIIIPISDEGPFCGFNCSGGQGPNPNDPSCSCLCLEDGDRPFMCEVASLIDVIATEASAQAIPVGVFPVITNEGYLCTQDRIDIGCCDDLTLNEGTSCLDAIAQRVADATQRRRSGTPGMMLDIDTDNTFLISQALSEFVLDVIFQECGDCDGNGLFDSCEIPRPDCAGLCGGDFNLDFVVDILDLLDFTSLWHMDAADFNGDGDTDVLDLLDFMAVWHPGCAPNQLDVLPGC